MSNYKNGDVINRTFEVVGLRNKVSEKGTLKGRYVMRALGDDLINPSGNFGFTDKQLTELAVVTGLPSWDALPRAIAKGGARLHCTAVFCAEGEQDLQDPSITFTKNWWKVENNVLELGDDGEAFVDEVLKGSIINANDTARADDRKSAAALRMQVLLGRKPATPAGAGPDPENDDDEDEDINLGTTAKAKDKRK